MNRQQKISKYQVMDEFNGGKRCLTVDYLANQLSVSTPTVRSRIRELRKDGIRILPTSEGYRIFDTINKESDAVQIRNLGRWLTASLITIGEIGKVAHKPMIEAKKYLHEKLDSEERRELRKICMFTTKLIDYIEVESEM